MGPRALRLQAGVSTVTAKRERLRQQRRWAEAHGLGADARGYLPTVQANLFAPLAPSTRAAFERGDASELAETATRPAKMRALRSSAVLVVNVFEHFVGANPKPLLDALGIEEELKHPLAFEAEARYPAGLPGHPPNLDVVLELTSGTIVGIESKFTEWLTPKRGAKNVLKDKYFEGGVQWWRNGGLPKCQALAAMLKNGEERFRFLDVPQLLKHALGLATARPARFELHYLYFDAPGPASRAQREELARFAERVGAELGFRVLTYQELYRRLCACGRIESSYLRYLGERYFQ